MALSSILAAMIWAISVVREVMCGERNLVDFVTLRRMFLSALPMRALMSGIASGWGCARCLNGLLAVRIVYIFGGVLGGCANGG